MDIKRIRGYFSNPDSFYKYHFLNFSKIAPNLILLIIILSFTVNAIYAQNNLDFYLRAAFANNPSIKEANNQIKTNELNKNLIDAQYIAPRVSLSANYLLAPYFNNNGTYLTSNPSPQAIGYDVNVTNGGLYSALINIEKNIFNSGLINANKNLYDTQIEGYNNAIQLMNHNLERDVTEQFLKTLLSQELYIVELSIVDTLQEQLNITGDLVLKGLGKQSDYLLLKIEAENQSISASQFYADFISNINLLNSLCGIKDTSFNQTQDTRHKTEERLKDSTILQLMPALLNLNNKTTYSKFLEGFKIDSMSVMNQQNIFEIKYLPQVNLFANAGLNAVELSEIQRKFGFSAGINFSLPLYDGNQKSITFQQSQISLNTIGYFRENQTILLLNKIKDSKTQIDFYEQNLEKISNQLNNYRQVIELTQAELFKGQLSMIDYITIIKNYLELKKNEISTAISRELAINQYNYWNW